MCSTRILVLPLM